MAQISQAQKVRLGIFLLTGLAILVTATLLLAGRTLIEERDYYSIRFSNKGLSFSGLEIGSAVKYSGIRVGRVEGIGIDPKDVSIIAVDISLSEGTPVAEDSTASLGSVGITGLKYIELSRGSPDARIRAPGEEIPAGDSLIDELSAKALSLASQMETILGNIEKMTDAANQERLASLLDNTSKVLAQNEENLRIITKNLRTASENGSEMLSQVHLFTTELRTTRAELDELIVTTQDTLGPKGLGETVTSANALLGNVNLMVRRNQLTVESSLRDLQTSAENLYDLTQTLKDNPSLLFRSNKTAGEDLVR